MATKIGDRFLPKRTPVNDKLGLSNNSVTTICFIDSSNVSVHIDRVPGFATITAVMPLSFFSANFIEYNALNMAKSFEEKQHFKKLYPDYFLKIIS